MTLDALTARSKTPFSERLLPRWQLRPTDVLLVDEAAMIDHERYANLLEAAADAGATLVQVGDDRQLNPVGPGGLWTIFHKFAAQQGTATELREIHRTRDPGQQQAWSDLREGRIEEALTWYRDVGQLRLYDIRPELLRGMVAEWWRHDRTATMIVDSSNAERDSLNRMAQAKRLEAGELGEQPFQLANGREVRTGDRVIFADHPHPLDLALNAPGKRVENGTEAIVRDVFAPLDAPAAAPPQAVTLELHEPAGSRLVQVDASAELELAYARHATKAQGMTVDTADIAIGAQTGQQELYEMASRSRENTRIHALRSEIEALDVDVKELEAARTEIHQEPQLAEMQLDRSSPEMATLRMFNQAELKPGQVVSFAEALPLREPTGVELGELGVVHDLHQGGVNFDYARVDLVGGRRVNVYQTDHVEHAPPDVTPAAVFEQPATVNQRNPYSGINLPLENGVIVQRGDQVRFAGTELEGRVVEVGRPPESPSSGGLVELSQGGQRVPLYGTSNVEVVKTAQEIAAEHVQQVEAATIQGIEKQALRSGPKRAVGEAEMEPAPEAKGTNLAVDHADSQRQDPAERERPAAIRHDAIAREQLAQEPQVPEPGAEPQLQPAPERLREAAEAAYGQPEPSSPEQAPEPVPEPSQPGSAADAHRQLEQQAADRSAGREAPDHSPQPQAEPAPQMEASR
ncbi:MAG: AAA family ATPase [Candidatus Dormibacteraeota bacterium]|nr:AAA family ATPase [Candidatus Dormibacteraeota bacterium]